MPTPTLDHRTAKADAMAILTERMGSAPSSTGWRLNDPTIWQQLLPGGVLSAAECRELASMARVREVAPGQSVFNRMQAAASLVALIDGEASLGLRMADGLFRTERTVSGPAWLDLSSAFIGVSHAVDAQALSMAKVVDLPGPSIIDCLERHPDLASRLIEGLAREVHALTFNNHELMHKDAPARLAHWLRQRCHPVPGCPGQAVVQLRERKRDVASQLAITPETLSRLMRSMTRQGVILVAGYTVQVRDIQALEQLARD